MSDPGKIYDHILCRYSHSFSFFESSKFLKKPLRSSVAVFVVFAHLLFSACGDKDTSTEYESFPVVSVIKIDTFLYTEYVTEIHAIQNVEIRARVTGYLEKFHVDEGSYVQAGQLLFTINDKEYVEEYLKAQALRKSSVVDVATAELELNNVLQLEKKKIVSAVEVTKARNKLAAQKAKKDEATANEAFAQIRLKYTKIHAPFDGIINRIPHKVGSLIHAGILLTTISENDDVYAYFDVSERDYLTYARNLKSDSIDTKTVTLILADGTEHPYKGSIETTEGVIDEKTGNIAFRARFKNPGKILKHGASGRVRLRKKLEGALIIPQKSTFEIQDKLNVYVVDKSNIVHVRNIESKNRLPHLFIVSKGLEEGEKIIYEGVQKVTPGMTIKPEMRNTRQVIKELEGK